MQGGHFIQGPQVCTWLDELLWQGQTSPHALAATQTSPHSRGTLHTAGRVHARQSGWASTQTPRCYLNHSKKGLQDHPATATWFQLHFFLWRRGRAPKGALQPCASLSCRMLLAGSTWPTPRLQMGSTVHTELVCPNHGCISLPYHWEKWLRDEKLLQT